MLGLYRQLQTHKKAIPIKLSDRICNFRVSLATYEKTPKYLLKYLGQAEEFRLNLYSLSQEHRKLWNTLFTLVKLGEQKVCM